MLVSLWAANISLQVMFDPPKISMSWNETEQHEIRFKSWHS